jgi:hypothetical protein
VHGTRRRVKPLPNVPAEPWAALLIIRMLSMQNHGNLTIGHVHQVLLCELAAIRAVAVQQPQYLGNARCSM